MLKIIEDIWDEMFPLLRELHVGGVIILGMLDLVRRAKATLEKGVDEVTPLGTAHSKLHTYGPRKYVGFVLLIEVIDVIIG
jgi:hypothetical protein